MAAHSTVGNYSSKLQFVREKLLGKTRGKSKMRSPRPRASRGHFSSGAAPPFHGRIVIKIAGVLGGASGGIFRTPAVTRHDSQKRYQIFRYRHFRRLADMDWMACWPLCKKHPMKEEKPSTPI